MVFLAEHLNGTNYTWPANNTSFVLTEPDRRIFNRLSGNQVLGMINFFGTSVGQLTINNGQRVEDLILHELPVEIKSELAVFNWLRSKYLTTATNDLYNNF